MLPAGSCLRCKASLPERPVLVGAGYCGPCRLVAEHELEAAVEKAKAVTDAGVKRLAEEMGLGAALESEQYGSKPTRLVHNLPKPRSKVCRTCGETFTGYRLLCEPCADAWEAQHLERQGELERQVALKQVAQRLQWANLPLVARRIEMLLPRPEVRGFAEAKDAVLSWLRLEGLPWLVLTGPWGVGKSHLAEGAVRALVDGDAHARWQPVVNLLTEMRRMVAAKADTDGFLTRVGSTPWLVLDDLGRERSTDWVQDALYRLVQGRQVSCLRTLVTTNETKASLTERVGGAIADRVFDRSLAHVVVLQGPSWR